jgi:hypothetical protein
VLAALLIASISIAPVIVSTFKTGYVGSFSKCSNLSVRSCQTGYLQWPPKLAPRINNFNHRPLYIFYAFQTPFFPLNYNFSIAFGRYQ